VELTKNLCILITTISNKNIIATINHKGAELTSLNTTSGKEYIWEGNPEFWGKHSPILFPIVGTLKNNTYKYKDHTYSLSRHGFARDMEFQLIQKTEDSVTFSLVYNDQTLQVYPFKFELQLIYTLEENSLHIAYKVLNKDNTELLFSLGAHPAFALNGKFEEYSIEMEKQETLDYYLLDNDLLSDQKESIALTDKRFALNYPLFENDALIFKNLQSESLTIFQQQTPLLRVDFNGFPYLGLWTKRNAAFVCVEPWFGYSDTTESNGNLVEKEGIQRLDAKGTFDAVFSITVL